MLHCKEPIGETHYDILLVKEDASYEEIRSGYKLAILNYHPDKLQNKDQNSDCLKESGEKFLKVQKAWEVLGHSKLRAAYDSELRAYRKDTGVADDVNLEDMTIQDGDEALELYYQCRCGDYLFVNSLELGEMGCTFSKDGNKVSFRTTDELPAAIVLPCSSCSLQVRLSIHTDSEAFINNM